MISSPSEPKQPHFAFGSALIFLLIGSAAAGIGLLTVNPSVTAFALAVSATVAALLWIPGEPPVLVFACLVQWLQASAAIFYADYYGIPLSTDWDATGVDIEPATWLSLLGVLVVAIGMRLALMRRSRRYATAARAEGLMLNPSRIFTLYISSLFAFTAVELTARAIPTAAQPILATTTLKWVLVFLLMVAVLLQRRGYMLLLAAILIEFVSGLLGFFSGFKSVFFMLLVVLPFAQPRLGLRRFVQIATVAAVVATMAVAWTAVKMEYRDFMNQGTRQQVVLVPARDRVAKLFDLITELDQQKLEQGLGDATLRMSYVKFFALCMENVPSRVPYERGDLWFGTLEHVLMPRFLFPNKPAINDSDRTSYYTGINFAGSEEGTSIGIGYMGESYIDFGPVGMFVPILLLGIFYGGIYRVFVDGARHVLLGFGIATSILLFGAYTIETSNIKLVGGNLIAALMMTLFARFGGELLWQKITQRTARHEMLHGLETKGTTPGA